MIRLEKMTQASRPQAETLEVEPSQLRFVGTMDEILAISGGAIVPVLIWYRDIAAAGESLAGFFLLDKDYGREHPFANPEDIGFRAFLIDSRFQGKGLGKAVMAQLPDFVRARYPQFHRIALTVNLKNPRALNLYLKQGFQDSGEHFLGGSAGPQHILFLTL